MTHKAMVTDAIERFENAVRANGYRTCSDQTQDEYASARAALTAALAQAETQPVAVQEGFVLIPIEPTREMWAAMADTLYGYKNRHHDKVAGDLYAAMLAAAPASPVPAKREAGVVKALEWREGPRGHHTDYADSILGQWASWEIQGHAYYRAPWMKAGRLSGATIQEAQAAAQADYETRILSTLSTSSTPADGEDRAAPVSNAEASREGCVGSMTADRAIYFLQRFKGDEKMLGPHEQWALDFAIAALTPAPETRKGRLHEWSVGGVCRDCGCLFAGLSRIDPCPGYTAPSKEGSTDE